MNAKVPPATAPETTAGPPWPVDQPLLPAGHPGILVTHFRDIAAYHPGLIARIFELERDSALTKRYVGCGGHKIHNLERWACREATLIDERAKALYRHVLNERAAIVDLSWCSIYRAGDYCMPHSHERSMASVVYCVDPGDDEEARDPVGGKFYFADPRIEACCRPVASYMTSPIFPELHAGSMIIFPSQIIHAVNPYGGSRPRITLSWNINSHAVPGDKLPVD